MNDEREGERPPRSPNLRHLYPKQKLPGESYEDFVARLTAEVCGDRRVRDENGDQDTRN
jgi:hypothetical protein